MVSGKFYGYPHVNMWTSPSALTQQIQKPHRSIASQKRTISWHFFCSFVLDCIEISIHIAWEGEKKLKEISIYD